MYSPRCIGVLLGLLTLLAAPARASGELPTEFWPSQTEVLAIRAHSRPVLSYFASLRRHHVLGFRETLPGGGCVLSLRDEDDDRIGREAFFHCRDLADPVVEETDTEIQVSVAPGLVVFSVSKDPWETAGFVTGGRSSIFLPEKPAGPWKYPGLPEDYIRRITDELRREHTEYRDVFAGCRQPQPILVGKEHQLCWLVPCSWSGSDERGFPLLMEVGSAFTFSKGAFYRYRADDEILYISPADLPGVLKGQAP